MTIVVVTIVDISHISGSGVATKELIRGLDAASRDRVIVVCPEPNGELPSRIKDCADSFYFLSSARKAGSPKWHLKIEIEVLKALWSILRHEDPDVVITRLSPSTLFPAPLCNYSGVPHILLVRGWVRRRDNAGKTKFGPLVEQLVRMNVRFSSDVYVAFEELREWVCSYRGENQSPVSILPNAVDPDLFSPEPISTAREQIGLDTDQFVVGFVGSLAPRHEISTLLRAGAELDDVQFVLVGDGQLRVPLEQLADELGINNRVRFVGQISHEKVPMYISAFDVGYGVISPEKASNPIKCYEYLACERPVITSRKEEFEFVDEIGAGVLVENVSVEEIAEGIETLRGYSKSELRQAGIEGNQYVQKHSTWEEIGRQLLNQYL